MKGKDPRLGDSQGQSSHIVMPKLKKEFKTETPHNAVEGSLGTQLLSKPVSRGETGENSSLRKGEVQMGPKELLGQITAEQEGEDVIKPIQEERTEYNEQVADPKTGATATLATDQNEKLEIIRPY